MSEDNRSNGNGLNGIITLIIVVILAILVIWALNTFKKDKGENGNNNNNNMTNELGGFANEEIDISNYDDKEDKGVLNAFRVLDNDKNLKGYLVKVAAKGYGGNIIMNITFDEDGRTIKDFSVPEHNESENIGEKIETDEFIKQVTGVPLPIVLSKKNYDVDEDKDINDMEDGVYIAEASEFSSGYKDVVTLKVENGKISEVIWDAKNEAGESKRQSSIDGKYVMTENGPLWHEQADLLSNFIIENQSTNDIFTNAEGKTDSVASVSISVQGFKELVNECIEQAVSKEEYGTKIDGISGATVSSEAAIDGINNAYKFLKEFILGE